MAEIQAKLELKGWNATQLKLRIPTIIRAYGDVLDVELKEQIKAVKWSWPNQTRRRNGSTAGTTRDIVDTGKFLRSQRRDYPDATTLRFIWDAKSDRGFMYAGIILTGYTTSTGKAMPPRNWIKPALDKFPLNAFFIKEWRRLGQNRL